MARKAVEEKKKKGQDKPKKDPAYLDGEITIKSSDGVGFLIEKSYCKLSQLVMKTLKRDNNASEIALKDVSSSTLNEIIRYLKEHKGKESRALPCPVRSTSMEQIVSFKWDALFINEFNKKEIFHIILGANSMDIKSLLHLGCAKIATLIKRLDQKEINTIIEEEERYEKEQNNNKLKKGQGNKFNSDNKNRNNRNNNNHNNNNNNNLNLHLNSDKYKFRDEHKDNDDNKDYNEYDNNDNKFGVK